MKITLTAMRADVGSIGGHLQPSSQMITAMAQYLDDHHEGRLIDRTMLFTGDDITVLCSHQAGTENAEIHALLQNAYRQGAAVAVEQGLYGAGQDLFDEGTTGAAKGFGPSIAELAFDERPEEAFLLFSMDKTTPGAFNLPFYLAFADPMHSPGLMLSKRMGKGFGFEIMDVVYKAQDRCIRLEAPEDLYNMAALLRDEERFAIRAIFSRTTGDQSAAVSTVRLHNVAGIVLGKDDPVAIVRVQDAFPATGEILAPFHLGPYVGGFSRGSHHGPLMPVRFNSGVSFFDGPPSVSCAAFSIREGRLAKPVDAFDHPFWDHVRNRIAEKAVEIRRQGFFGNAMQPFESLAYGGIMHRLNVLEERFVVEKPFGS